MRARARSTRCRRAAERRNTVDRQPDRLPDADLDPRTERRCRSAGCLLRQRRTPPAAGNAVRFLAVPDERLPHLRGVVRDVRRARPQLRRRPHRCGVVRAAAGGGEHRAAAVLVDHLRPGDDLDAEGQPGRRARLVGRHRAVRRRLPDHRTLRIRPPDPARRRAAAQRLPVVVLRAGGHARAARRVRHRLAGGADAAGEPPGTDRRQPAPADLPVDVLAFPGHHLDRRLQLRLPDGSAAMSAARPLRRRSFPPGGTGAQRRKGQS
mmetsp:Transcript_33954/g.61690  ORF Transcript_33954/g.61690 Transcript_33954/m.61690 type:complete len:265 (-) Transcript_33954:657-1451(-)